MSSTRDRNRLFTSGYGSPDVHSTSQEQADIQIRMQETCSQMSSFLQNAEARLGAATIKSQSSSSQTQKDKASQERILKINELTQKMRDVGTGIDAGDKMVTLMSSV